ncbi:hypothetical protein FGO68_gene7788 [Halteria grandinella]|uniref:HTH La-type RNA-binding domain-containing protein n=1 Tax=Halteria grandinella TaxID=5974 RepID=A0A8J8T434_HALGN|nr:hypothetical protein FGO68_gene7788 [Halteria grandinella]
MTKLIPQSPSKAQKQTSNGTPASAEFLQSQQENIDKSIRRQVEYYFSDTNFPKDKYLQKKCTENPEGFISLRDIMSFNQMRKLTQSWEQVVRALEGSTVVEFSPDFRLIRKKQA